MLAAPSAALLCTHAQQTCPYVCRSMETSLHIHGCRFQALGLLECARPAGPTDGSTLRARPYIQKGARRQVADFGLARMVLDLQGALMVAPQVQNPNPIYMLPRWRTLGWRAWCWTCRAR